MSPRKAAASRSKKEQGRSTCPISCALDLVGDKWTLLVVRDLALGCKRYGDFLESPEGYPTNILADRLKRLEGAGMIERVLYSKRPPRAEYFLTERGRTLLPLMESLSQWGLANIPGTVPWVRPLVEEPAPEPAPEAVVETAQAAPEPFVSEVEVASEPEPPAAILEPEPVEEVVAEESEPAPPVLIPEPVEEPEAAVPMNGGNGHHHEPVDQDVVVGEPIDADSEAKEDDAPEIPAVDRLRANPDERQDQMSLW